MQILKTGAIGNNVIKLQILLNGHLNPGIRIKNDGHFGNQTQKAVKAFQKKKGLEVDEMVGPETWSALSGNNKTHMNTQNTVESSIIKRINKKTDSQTGSLTGYHVGFYITANKAAISLLGGNQGNAVKKSVFMLRSYEIVAYRRPVNPNLGVPLQISSMLSRIA